MGHYSDVKDFEHKDSYASWAFRIFAADFLGFDYEDLGRWEDMEEARQRVVDKFEDWAIVSGDYDPKVVQILEGECTKFAHIFAGLYSFYIRQRRKSREGPMFPNPSLLKIGCNYGFFTALAYNFGFDVVCVDSNVDRVMQGRKTLRHLTIPEDRIVCADIRQEGFFLANLNDRNVFAYNFVCALMNRKYTLWMADFLRDKLNSKQRFVCELSETSKKPWFRAEDLLRSGVYLTLEACLGENIGVFRK